MAALTVLTPAVSGALLGAVAAAGGGDTFVNNGSTLLYLKNGSGGSITVTIITAGATRQGVAIADVSVVLAAGEERVVGPFDPSDFNGASGISLTYSGVTSLTVRPISLI